MKVVQHNLNRQKEALFTTLEVCREKGVDIILLQEPYIGYLKDTDSYICIQHSAYYAVPPTRTLSGLSYRPRVLTYIRKNSNLQFNPRYDICNDQDLQVIEVLGVQEPYFIVNLYNEKQLNATSTSTSSIRTIERLLLQIPLQKPTLLVGDFNLHHYWWNSAVQDNQAEKATPLVNWLNSKRAKLLNDSNTIAQKGGTFYRSNLKSTSVIDLAFEIGFKRTKWLDWDYLDSSGSDHEVITFKSQDNSTFKPTSTLRPLFNYKKAN